jgi:hypothetical protein
MLSILGSSLCRESRASEQNEVVTLNDRIQLGANASVINIELKDVRHQAVTIGKVCVAQSRHIAVQLVPGGAERAWRHPRQDTQALPLHLSMKRRVPLRPAALLSRLVEILQKT